MDVLVDWPGDKREKLASVESKLRAVGQGTSMPDELSLSVRHVVAAGGISEAADTSAAAGCNPSVRHWATHPYFSATP
ncbi:MAG TPA: hypothetical protein VHE81_03215 [Lacipirellulaceae bacterium]|nr:hypothetical protein [Lacipirellulaceae bacterium]